MERVTETAFYVTGEPRLESGGQVVSTRRKELALAAYLVRQGSRGSTREELSSLLWEDRDRGKARQSLRQALLELKRHLGEMLLIDGEQVSLDSSRLRVDVLELEADLGEGRLAAAVEKWKGEFLPGMEDIGGEAFRGWLEGERASLRMRIRSAFARLAGDAASIGGWSEAVEWAERWAASFPLDEDAHLQLGEALNLDGRGAAAVSRLAAYRARVQVELGVPPSPAVLALQTSLERAMPSARRGRSPGSAALFTPDVVGRDPALAELGTAWSEIRTGGCVVMAVEAESGMGRTRLVEEFIRRVRQSDEAVVLHAKGRRTEEAEQWSGIRQLLDGVEAAPGLTGASPAALATLSVWSPGLRTRFPSLPPAAQVPSDARSELAELIEAIADERPVLLVLDDLTRVDKASASLVIGACLRSPRRLLVVATVATDDPATPEALESLRSLGSLRRLKLPALDVGEIEALLESMLQLAPGDRHQLAARLHAEGGGSPFYAVEMTAALVDEGLLAATEEGGWRLMADGDWSIPQPASIREAMTRRVVRLSPRAREVAETVSVSQSPCDRESLLRRSGLPHDVFDGALEELVRAKIVRASGTQYEFTQDATAGVVSGMISSARRRALERTGGSRNRRTWWLIGAGTAVAGLTAFALLRSHDRPSLDRNLALAAPLRNETGDPALDPIGDLAADWITQGIAESGIVHVVSPQALRASVRTVKSQTPSEDRESRLALLASETGAGTVIGGSYYRAGDSLMFQLRITDATNGRVLSAPEPIRGGVADPSRALELLRERSVSALALLFGAQVSGMSQNASRPPALAAYKEFVQGLDLQVRYRYPEALDHYRRARELDSTFGSPVVWSAMAYWSLDDYVRTDSMLQIAARLQDRLSTFDGLLAANQRGELHGDYVAALSAAEEMTRVTSGSEGFILVGQESLRLNRVHHAVNAFRRADPDRGWIKGWEGYWGFLARAQHLAGDLEGALEAAQEAGRRYPSSPYGLTYEAAELAAMHRTSELNATLAEAESRPLDPGWPPAMAMLNAAIELRVHGHPDEARQMGERGLRSIRAQPRPPEGFADRIDLALADVAEDWSTVAQRAAALPDDSTGYPNRDGYLGLAAAATGDTVEASSRSARLARVQPFGFGNASLWQARIAVRLGHKDEAIQFLRQAMTEGAPRGNFSHDVDLLGLRGQRPFDELIRPAD
ncbi:MAG TPA: AAA family ATPase [Gemmatimonadales bacterium]